MTEVRKQAVADAPKKKRWPTNAEKREIRERARKVKLRLMKHARARRLSFTAMMKRELPGWPKWRGPKLTLARAEAIADRLDRKAEARAALLRTADRDAVQPSNE